MNNPIASTYTSVNELNYNNTDTHNMEPIASKTNIVRRSLFGVSSKWLRYIGSAAVFAGFSIVVWKWYR